MSKEITITIIDRAGESHIVQVPTDMQLSLMEVCKAYDLPVKGTCGGMSLCSTCHIYIESNHELYASTDAEEGMLDQAFNVDEKRSRLGCQIMVREELDNLVIRLAPEEL